MANCFKPVVQPQEKIRRLYLHSARVVCIGFIFCQRRMRQSTRLVLDVSAPSCLPLSAASSRDLCVIKFARLLVCSPLCVRDCRCYNSWLAASDASSTNTPVRACY